MRAYFVDNIKIYFHYIMYLKALINVVISRQRIPSCKNSNLRTFHPGRVKSIVTVDLPRPRDIAAIRTTMYYNELFQEIWRSLRDEVLKSKENELARQGG